MFDKKTVLAFILIAVILIGWQYWWAQQQPPPTQVNPALQQDSTLTQQQQAIPTGQQQQSVSQTIDTSQIIPDTVPERLIEVETNRYYLTLSSKGGGIVKLTLKDYNYSDSGNVQLLPYNSVAVPSVVFKTAQFSDTLLTYLTDNNDFTLYSENESQTVEFAGVTSTGTRITKIFTFYGNSYHFDVNILVESPGLMGPDLNYLLAWHPEIPPTEPELSQDYEFYKGGYYGSEGFEKVEDFDDGKLRLQVNEFVQWVGSRSKYFTYIILPQETLSSGALFFGDEMSVSEKGQSVDRKRISAAIQMPLGGAERINNKFRIFAGAIDYHELKTYGQDFEDMKDWGWNVISPFSHAVYWFITNSYKIVPNYGVVLIMLALALKLLTFPLTRKSLQGMQKMQELGPRMQELKEKYKDNPKKMNQMTMKLYKDEKVNPFGSCLMLLPQMPIFFGLYNVLQSTLELRQASFTSLWPDLSQPDTTWIMLVTMAVSMFIQQKVTMKDPKQKMMVYLMPAFMLFIFKSFPVGLVLYWTAFNLLTLVETLTIRKPMQAKVQVISK